MQHALAGQTLLSEESSLSYEESSEEYCCRPDRMCSVSSTCKHLGCAQHPRKLCSKEEPRSVMQACKFCLTAAGRTWLRADLYRRGFQVGQGVIAAPQQAQVARAPGVAVAAPQAPAAHGHCTPTRCVLLA